MRHRRNATFSEVTRQLDDLRSQIEPMHVCNAVLVNAGEKVQKLGPQEIMPHYKRKRVAADISGVSSASNGES